MGIYITMQAIRLDNLIISGIIPVRFYDICTIPVRLYNIQYILVRPYNISNIPVRRTKPRCEALNAPIKNISNLPYIGPTSWIYISTSNDNIT